jgi:hypothetical protein
MMADSGPGIDVDIVGPGILLFFDIINNIAGIPLGYSSLNQFPGSVDSFTDYFKHRLFLS